MVLPTLRERKHLRDVLTAVLNQKPQDQKDMNQPFTSKANKWSSQGHYPELELMNYGA